MDYGSTSFLARLRRTFLSNPVGARVVLPDGSLAVVRRVLDTEHGRSYRVQCIDRNGRFRAHAGLSCWYSGDELRLHYYSVSAAEMAS